MFFALLADGLFVFLCLGDRYKPLFVADYVGGIPFGPVGLRTLTRKRGWRNGIAVLGVSIMSSMLFSFSRGLQGIEI